jgi:sugar phosphate isomerase/epimerase
MRAVIAVQLYTLRAQLAENLEGTLEALAATGVREVELAGLYGRSPAEFRRVLDASGLSAPSAHVALDEITGFDADTLGVQTLVVPSVPRPADDAEADALVERIVAARDQVHVGFAYHNHDFEFGPVDLWSRLLAVDLDLEPDVGWLRVAGHDPVTMLDRLTGRCPLVHAKDVRRTADGWEDVPAGDGELDWPAIRAAAPESRFVIELDHPSADPLADVRRSLETLR